MFRRTLLRFALLGGSWEGSMNQDPVLSKDCFTAVSLIKAKLSQPPSEFFNGQLEFFNGQAPDGIKTFGSSLCMTSIAFGNYFSSVLVIIVVKFTSGESSPGWILGDPNHGHLDSFFFLLTGLTVVALLVNVFYARWYKCMRLERREVEEGDGEKDVGNV